MGNIQGTKWRSIYHLRVLNELPCHKTYWHTLQHCQQIALLVSAPFSRCICKNHKSLSIESKSQKHASSGPLMYSITVFSKPTAIVFWEEPSYFPEYWMGKHYPIHKISLWLLLHLIADNHGSEWSRVK